MATSRVLLVWTTETNSTRKMADAVRKGVQSVPHVSCTDVVLETGTEMTFEEVAAHDALILGTPVRHRNMHHRIKRFIEETLETAWLDDRMVGMVGGTFSIGGGHGDAGAGAEMCQLGMLAAMAANGMILTPLPKCTPGADHAGLHWGPAGRSGGARMEPYWPSEPMVQAAFHHGANIARLTHALHGRRNDIFVRGNEAPAADLVAAFRAGAAQDRPAVPDADANPAYRRTAPDGFVSGVTKSDDDQFDTP
ncbi:hypothetical protein [Sulfitobacter sp. S190]|uniref:hypothetical protein n=1 Tax=Sulfitobacter sp. S190 TaxID=2867022 RepID=UPI0021A627F1|nr:hypothetical protein [Sulfitobacter sp. S190]UWR24520.1 hypothetical protein K3756_18900 [Sulfitobacter sp. S190]